MLSEVSVVSANVVQHEAPQATEVLTNSRKAFGHRDWQQYALVLSAEYDAFMPD